MDISAIIDTAATANNVRGRTIEVRSDFVYSTFFSPFKTEKRIGKMMVWESVLIQYYIVFACEEFFQLCNMKAPDIGVV